MSETFQIHLSAPHCSGRAVRYRMLNPSEKDKVLLVAAQIAGKDGSQADLSVAIAREGIKRMLVSVTDAHLEPAKVPEAKFMTVSAADLEMPGPMHFDTLFTGKDDSILSIAYRRLHETNPAEVEAILGKALPVSAG